MLKKTLIKQQRIYKCRICGKKINNLWEHLTNKKKGSFNIKDYKHAKHLMESFVEVEELEKEVK